MKCPYCGSEIADNSRFCTVCGADLQNLQGTPALAGGKADSAKAMEKVANTGLVLGAAAREARLYAEYDPADIISVRAYNAIIVGVLLYGIVVNILLCWFVGDVYEYVHPIVFLVAYLILAFGGVVLSSASHKPILSFLGYNMVVVPFGLVISTLVEAYGGIGSEIVTLAFLYTLLISAGMGAASIAFPKFFSKIGGALLGVLIGVVIAEVVLLLLGFDQSWIDWIVAGLFSLYIGYDVYRSQQFAKTVDNAVDCALDIYLDIANLFLRLLQILGKRRK